MAKCCFNLNSKFTQFEGSVDFSKCCNANNRFNESEEPEPTIDPDAEAFLTAASITDPTITSAIDTLVIDLKAANVWTKMKAIYPIVGGTASTHKWNLKDPRDLDAAFRLQFFGGITHSATGVQGNGVNGYANTFLNDFSILNLSNKHISLYSRTDSSAAINDMGLQDSGIYNSIVARYIDDQSYLLVGGYYVNDNLGDSLGLFIANKPNSGNVNGYKNGSLVGTNLSTSFGINIEIPLMVANVNGVNSGYSDREYCFFSIGEGLSNTEQSNLYTAVQAFQTTLSRNV